MVKSREYDPATTLDSLQVKEESRAQARQRMGRAGRVSAGKCFRLFTEESFEEDLPENTVPEIRRCNLASVVLQMKAMGIDDVLGFDFMDPPSRTALLRSLQQLSLLGALRAEDATITPLGQQMVAFPVDPMAARAIVKAMDLGVAADVCAIMAMLSSDASLFTTKKSGSSEGAGDSNRAKFAKTAGDHVTMLHAFEAYRASPRKDRVSWCESAGLNAKQMSRVLDVFRQLMEIVSTLNRGGVTKTIASGSSDCRRGGAHAADDDDDAGSSPPPTKAHRSESDGSPSHRGHDALVATPLSKADAHRDHELARTAITFGYFLHAAYYSFQANSYLTIVGSQPVALHPSSVLFRLKKKPPLVVFHSVVRTTKNYLRDVMASREEWLRDASPALFGSAVDAERQ
jgi:HrpA-like RNA helicase